jgi:hypothetical protein
MEEKLKLSRPYFAGTLIMVAIGLAAVIFTLVTDSTRGWANLLLNNVYFVSLSAGALLFLSIQRVTHSGWSAGFIRVPEAMAGFLPVSAVLFLIMIFGTHSLYHWTDVEGLAQDPLLSHKAPYLNLPFWTIRMVIYFGLWILMFFLIRRASLKEDQIGGLELFKKLEHLSRIYIFIILISFCLAMIDWVMHTGTAPSLQ